MFYEESKINDNLNCEKCKHRFDEPRILPCGKTICKKCTFTLEINQNRSKCILCEKNHFIDDDGLPLNHLIYNFLLQNPVDVSRGEYGEKLKDNLKGIEFRIDEMLNLLYNSIDHIKEYYMNLENEIQLTKEEHIQAVEEYHQEITKKIAECKIRRISQIESNKLDENQTKNSENLVGELKSFKEKWSSYLRNTNVDDKLLCDANVLGEKLVRQSDEQKTILDNLIFDDARLIFLKSNKISMNSVIGSVKKRVLAHFLTTEQEFDLFKLCNLNSDDSWSLVYQATRDGFSSNDFHSKCDSKNNTLVIIKSTIGNIFGGYTQCDWSGNHCSKNDASAFLFSFINKDNEPICIQMNQEDALNPDNQSIYCDPNCGPTFGRGSDFYICSNSNTQNSSSSNFSCSFLHPKYKHDSNEAQSFLAGSQNFLTLDILVLSKNL